MKTELKAMRDVFIEKLYGRMKKNKKIVFLSADFGSPKLDRLRADFKDRFINVGIAEQNLINVATGLAIEGYTVYAYGLAPFISMRAYEQIRINISLQSQLKEMNINLIGVGAGLSYEVSGPTHHCLEDLAVIRTLPNLMLFSPSDWVTAEKLVDFSIKIKRPKYFRFDAKPLPAIYTNKNKIRITDGFNILREGTRLCLVSTGYFTHTALKIADKLRGEGVYIGVVDVLMLKPFDLNLFYEEIKNFKYVVTLEEGFIDKGGLDSLVSVALSNCDRSIQLIRLGFKDSYVFDLGDRNYLHKAQALDEEAVYKRIKNILK